MSNNIEGKEPDNFWPATFEEVEEAQRIEMLKLSPARRLEMAEELLEFAVLAGVLKAKSSEL